MAAQLMSLDQRLFHLVNETCALPVLDWWAALVRATEIWALPALLIVALALWKGSPRARSAALLSLLVFPAGDALIVRPAKALFERPRPGVVQSVRSVRLAKVKPRILALGEPLLIQREGPVTTPRGNRSFPSGHAWNAFAVATVLALAHRRWGWLAYVLATAIAFARVHAGLHWPSDVVLAGLLSVPVTIGLVWVFERLGRALRPRLPAGWRWARELPSVLARPAP